MCLGADRDIFHMLQHARIKNNSWQLYIKVKISWLPCSVTWMIISFFNLQSGDNSFNKHSLSIDYVI